MDLNGGCGSGRGGIEKEAESKTEEPQGVGDQVRTS